MFARLREYFAPLPDIEQKAVLDDGMMVTSSYQLASWMDTDYDTLITEGFLKNSAVSACISALAFAFPEPPLMVKNKAEKEMPDHALQQLLRRPNPQCGEAELMQIVANYLGNGGNCYIYKARAGGRVKELWPFSVGQMGPEKPDGIGGLIKWYLYRKPNGERARIPAKDIIHLKWPVIDPWQPWLGLSPMRQVVREIDTDNELTVYLKAVIQNDAAPRTILAFPDGTYLSPEQQELIAAQFGIRHGGERRGGVSILTGGADVHRMAMNLQELTFDTLRAVPEARICAAFRTPPIIAGLNVGLEHATYSNIEQASKDYTNRLLIPLWHMVASEFESDLVPEFAEAGSLTIDHDLTKVAAMQENADSKYTRAIGGYDKGIMWLNEAREHIGLDAVPDGDVLRLGASVGTPALPGAADAKSGTPILGYHIEQGVVTRNEARAQLGLAPEDESQGELLRRLTATLSVVQVAVTVGIPLNVALKMVNLDVPLPPDAPPPDQPPIDVTPIPPKQLTDQAAKALYTMAVKEMKAKSTEPLEKRMQRVVEGYLAGQYEDWAAAGGSE